MSKIQSNRGVDVGKNTPIDYVIAGVFGLLGGPVGVVLSVLIIHLLAPHAGAKQKWVVWFLAGIVSVPFIWVLTGAITSNETSSSPSEQRPPRRITTPAQPQRRVETPQRDELGFKRLVSIEEQCNYSYPQICK